MYLLNHRPSGPSLQSQEKFRRLYSYFNLIKLLRDIAMKKSAILINIIVIVQFMVLIFYVSELRCQNKAKIASPQYQAEHIDKNPQAIKNDNEPDDKNIGVRIIELIIKHNLNNRYQKLEPEELEEIIQKGR
jgi:hypothetical protein